MTNAHQKCGKLHIRVSQSKKGEETIYTNTKVCFCKLLIEYNLVETHSSSRHIILKQLILKKAKTQYFQNFSYTCTIALLL